VLQGCRFLLQPALPCRGLEAEAIQQLTGAFLKRTAIPSLALAMSSYPLPFSCYKVAAFFSNPPFRAGDLKLMRGILELTGAFRNRKGTLALPSRVIKRRLAIPVGAGPYCTCIVLVYLMLRGYLVGRYLSFM